MDDKSKTQARHPDRAACCLAPIYREAGDQNSVFSQHIDSRDQIDFERETVLQATQQESRRGLNSEKGATVMTANGSDQPCTAR